MYVLITIISKKIKFLFITCDKFVVVLYHIILSNNFKFFFIYKYNIVWKIEMASNDMGYDEDTLFGDNTDVTMMVKMERATNVSVVWSQLYSG